MWINILNITFFCLYFILYRYLHVWVRIRIRNTDPQRSWIPGDTGNPYRTFLLREAPPPRPAENVGGGGVLEPAGTCSGVGGHSITEDSTLASASSNTDSSLTDIVRSADVEGPSGAAIFSRRNFYKYKNILVWVSQRIGQFSGEIF